MVTHFYHWRTYLCCLAQHAHDCRRGLRFAASAQIARTSASRCTAYASSQQTAASPTRPALARRSHTLPRRDRQRCGEAQVEVGHVDVRLIPVDQSDQICSHADVVRIGGVAVNDARQTADEPRPRCPTSSNAFRGHRPEVDRKSPIAQRPKLAADRELPCASPTNSASGNDGGDALHQLSRVALDSPASSHDTSPHGEVSGIATRPDIRRTR